MNREDYKYYKEIERLGLQIECPYIIDEEFELVEEAYDALFSEDILN